MHTHHVTIGAEVVKRFRSAARGEPEREWQALRLLAEHAPGLAPIPIRFDPPTVTMSRLPGAPLTGRLGPGQLERLAAAVAELHAVPSAAIPSGPSLAAPDRHLAATAALLPARIPDQLPERVRRAHRAARDWLAGPVAQRLAAEQPAPVLGRADFHLRNFLDDGRRIRMVDFEDSGRSDRSLELALLVEHISARATPDRAWSAVLARFQLTAAERARLRAARCAEAIFWLAMLLPRVTAVGVEPGPAAARNPPAALPRQAERVLALR